MTFLLRLLSLLVVAGVIVFFDVATKEWALDTLAGAASSGSYPFGGRGVVQGLFGGIDVAFVLAVNTGTAWGLLSDYPVALTVARLAIGVLLFFYYFLSRRLSNCGRFGLILILGGACGNLWGLRTYGYVVDFIAVYLWGWSYPIFNVADMAIVLGAIAFLFSRKS